MIILPVIPLSARFRDHAKREPVRFLRRVRSMSAQELRPHLLCGRSGTVGAMIRIGYDCRGAFRDLAIALAPASASVWNEDLVPLFVRLDPLAELRRLRVAIYLRHSATLLRRRVGPRPFLVETDAELAMTCQDSIPPFVLYAACGQEGDEALIRHELSARLARTEIETRRAESNHARMARLAATRAAEVRPRR